MQLAVCKRAVAEQSRDLLRNLPSPSGVRDGQETVGPGASLQLADDGIDHNLFEGRCRKSPGVGVRPAGDEAVRDIVAMAATAPDRMRRGQPVAGLVAELAEEKGASGLAPGQ